MDSLGFEIERKLRKMMRPYSLHYALTCSQDKQWGREKYFQLNREYPLFEEVRSIVSKTIGAIPLIAQSLKKVEGICEAYLYRSFARH